MINDVDAAIGANQSLLTNPIPNINDAYSMSLIERNLDYKYINILIK